LNGPSAFCSWPLSYRHLAGAIRPHSSHWHGPKAFNASLGFVASPHGTRCDPSLPQIAVALTGVSGVPGRRRSEPVGT